MDETHNPVESRLSVVRRSVGEQGLDAVLVTHPPNVRYLTGFSGTAGAIVLTAARVFLVVDFRYVTTARELARTAGAGLFDVVLVEKSYDETLCGLLIQLRCSRIGVEGGTMPVNRFNHLSKALAAAAPTPLRTPDPCPVLVPTERLVERARIVKDAREVATLRHAADRLSRVALDIGPAIQPGRTELEIAAEVDAAIRRAGFSRPAFETIVASGPNSALPHAQPTDRVLGPGEGVLLDFGGVYDGYCVDLTRTVQLPPVDEGFRRLFEAVAAAWREAIAAVRPGIPASDVDAAARAALDRYGLADAFGHGTGHGLGLEVHEDPRIGRPTSGIPDVSLEAGMVFTIEPGAYVPGVGGVRIEDDVLVTATGCELLTHVPLDLSTGSP